MSLFDDLPIERFHHALDQYCDGKSKSSADRYRSALRSILKQLSNKTRDQQLHFIVSMNSTTYKYAPRREPGTGSREPEKVVIKNVFWPLIQQPSNVAFPPQIYPQPIQIPVIYNQYVPVESRKRDPFPQAQIGGRRSNYVPDNSVFEDNPNKDFCNDLIINSLPTNCQTFICTDTQYLKTTKTISRARPDIKIYIPERNKDTWKRSNAELRQLRHIDARCSHEDFAYRLHQQLELDEPNMVAYAD